MGSEAAWRKQAFTPYPAPAELARAALDAIAASGSLEPAAAAYQEMARARRLVEDRAFAHRVVLAARVAQGSPRPAHGRAALMALTAAELVDWYSRPTWHREAVTDALCGLLGALPPAASRGAWRMLEHGPGEARRAALTAVRAFYLAHRIGHLADGLARCRDAASQAMLVGCLEAIGDAAAIPVIEGHIEGWVHTNWPLAQAAERAVAAIRHQDAEGAARNLLRAGAEPTADLLRVLEGAQHGASELGRPAPRE